MMPSRALRARPSRKTSLSCAIVLACSVQAGTLPAQAADHELDSRIDAVTVYPDAATITRLARVDLMTGASTLILKGLPASVDPASVRVSGETTGLLAIGSVDVRLAPGDAKPVIDPVLEGRLNGLRATSEQLRSLQSTLEAKRAMILRFAASGPETFAAQDKPIDPGQWTAAWSAVGTGLADVNGALVDVRNQLRDAEADMAALERARPVPPRPGAPKRDVYVSVDTPAGARGALRVEYRVFGGVGWNALYDARLDTGAKDRPAALDLTRRASIVQRSGEDWTDVALSVSTASVRRGTAAPQLSPMIVSFLEPRPEPRLDSRNEATMPRRAAPMIASPAAPEQDGLRQRAETVLSEAETLAKVVETAPVVDAGTFQTLFRVPGRASIAGDGAVKTLTLGAMRAEPVLTARAAPALDPTAYLEAAFVNADDTPILPGEVALHRDGTFVGRGRLGLTAQGDRVELGFGADDRIRIVRTPIRKRETDAGWIGSSRSDLAEFRTVVRNLHDRPMRITLSDRMPVSENAAIVVEPLPQQTPAAPDPAGVKANGDRRGVVTWSHDYKPGEERDIRFGWRIRWPAEREIRTSSLWPQPR